MSQSIYLPAQVRELERIAIEEQGIPGYTLMTRAAELTFSLIRPRYPDARQWLVVCGSGNNAGDGYVIARLALGADIPVSVIAVSDPARLTGDAATAYAEFSAAGGIVDEFSGDALPACDVVIDALLGTGLKRPIEGLYAQAVQAMNAADAGLIAVDIPSGLNGATGEKMGVAVHADVTATYVGMKAGLYLGAGPTHCGEIVYDDLGIASIPYERVPAVMRSTGANDVRRLLPPRLGNAHKGLFGHVLIIGGNTGMGGAVRLAGEAALRSGAGLVSVATRNENVSAILAGRPELMARGIASGADLEPLVARADLIAIGPGLGTDEWAQHMLQSSLASGLPLVIDADGLNLLAASPSMRDNWVLTPHPGEAGRLLGVSTGDIQADRLGSLVRLHEQYGGTVLLKGSGTLVAGETGLPWLVRAGNPGMATAGMGDVLTGVIAALLAQCPDAMPADAVAAAAWLHASAGDRAAQGGQRGLIASDVSAELRGVLNEQV
jgi:NAD(P)H-hydrate epimerase